MANEILISAQTGKTVYAIIFNRIGQVFRVDTFVFENYLTGNYANYVIALTQYGVSSPFYAGNFPTTIVAGVYGVVGKQQISGSAAETDPTLGVQGDYQWNGTVGLPLSDLATSGQVGQIGPLRLARGTQILNFPFKLVSSTDHVSSLLSGIVSGQISRDGGVFTALQSGAFTEIGLGWYVANGLTSGDLLANTAALHFTGVGISGGTSDPRDFGIVLQKTSGQ